VAVPINQMGGGIPSSQQSSVNPSSNPATTTMNAQQQNPQDTASSATTTNGDQQTQSSSLKLGPFDGVGLMPAAKHAAQAIRQEPPAASRERGWNPAPPAEPAYQKLVAEPASETCHA
jgi:hypothetical protein